MKKISVSAPGKLLLFGEHAVVYQRPCIVTAIDQRMVMSLEWLSEKKFQLDARDVFIQEYQKPITSLCVGDFPKAAQFVERAVKNFHDLYPLKFGVKITTKSDFSATFGFGSSSASTVCAIKGLAELCEISLTNKEIFNLAYKTVLEIQGSGSGFDVAAAVYGGTLYYLTAGKIIEPMNVENMPLVVGYTGFKADTPTIVREVADKMLKKPDFFSKLYDDIAHIVDTSREAFMTKKWNDLGELMNKNQAILEEIGVSSNKLSLMIQAAKRAGAFGAKLSGAGVGDCMIAFVSQDKKSSVERALEDVGGQVVHVRPNAEGVRREKM